VELIGKIIQLLPEKSGESARGPWRKQDYIIETEDQYPKKVCFSVWSEKIDEFAIEDGERLIVSINLESREYNDRWYTDVKAWRVSRTNSSSDNASGYESERSNDTQSEELSFSEDEIPF
tara:strand:+ start:285 stop:644 length:360 start_codon:yes stop_codon:yes gene_type:complete